MFHAALMIGPWLIEWNSSSLCIPRKCLSRAAILSADVQGSIASITDLDKAVNTIAKVIVYWNTHKSYKTNPDDKRVVRL